MTYFQFLKLENVKGILNQQFQSITTAAIVISITTLASRFLGLIRDHILAGTFGAGEILDIYYASFRIPDLIYNLLVLGALQQDLFRFLHVIWMSAVTIVLLKETKNPGIL